MFSRDGLERENMSALGSRLDWSIYFLSLKFCT